MKTENLVRRNCSGHFSVILNIKYDSFFLEHLNIVYDFLCVEMQMLMNCYFAAIGFCITSAGVNAHCSSKEPLEAAEWQPLPIHGDTQVKCNGCRANVK